MPATLSARLAHGVRTAVRNADIIRESGCKKIDMLDVQVWRPASSNVRVKQMGLFLRPF